MEKEDQKQPKNKKKNLIYLAILILSVLAIALLIMGEYKDRALKVCQAGNEMLWESYGNTNIALDNCYNDLQERIEYAQNHSTGNLED